MSEVHTTMKIVCIQWQGRGVRWQRRAYGACDCPDDQLDSSSQFALAAQERINDLPTRHTLRDVGPSNGCAASRQEFDRHPPRSACVAVGESLNHGRALPERRPATSLRDRRRPNRRLSSANVRGRGRGTITCLKQSTQCCPPGVFASCYR